MSENITSNNEEYEEKEPSLSVKEMEGQARVILSRLLKTQLDIQQQNTAMVTQTDQDDANEYLRTGKWVKS